MKPSKKNVKVGVAVLILIGITGLFTIPVTLQPPDNTRLILERSKLTYISPPCFDQAVITNNLSESTLVKTKELDFKPDSVCTEQSLAGVKMSAYNVLLHKLGLKKDYWNW
ncbi:hypothetical protein [Paenibacillus agricola]|uniref:Uncharacterized protein n=1 Tax=Paenibacillus agricola TaxID=2716264 RepID=A0ABX0J939_9BACL|nr:hypothetical protein [Paenibacillus agricola]NHN30521.1 hypothetical protein [Paenibacillus agricola]